MVDTPDTEVVTPPSVSEVVESAETIEVKSARPRDDKGNNPDQASQVDNLANAEALVSGLAERAKTDKGAPFEPDVLSALAILRQGDPAEYQRVREGLRKAGVSRRDLDREVQKQTLRVINSGANDSAGATERAGPYKVISNAICHEKKTPDGPVTMPLCNFNVRMVVSQGWWKIGELA